MLHNVSNNVTVKVYFLLEIQKSDIDSFKWLFKSVKLQNFEIVKKKSLTALKKTIL